ncbi:MAG: hypothetical protein SVU32_08895 [Candidatus Nanohaloarchaea archaeon]|nr:hypothetical protein [Candidatus Nanohaloarchaea archaeon]
MSDTPEGGMEDVDNLLENDQEAGFPQDVEFEILAGTRGEIMQELYELRDEHTIYQLDYQLTHGRSGAKSYEKETKRELFVAYGPE